MKLIINGKNADVEAVTVAELISQKGLPEKQIIVDFNGAIIKREDWKATLLTEGGSLEILRLVGGG
jgi:thiamine biosynthesis protein ThiS